MSLTQSTARRISRILYGITPDDDRDIAEALRFNRANAIYDFTLGSVSTGGVFTRASRGTYLDRNGVLRLAEVNTPRAAYDPNSRPLGLLIEEPRTNLAWPSDNKQHTNWGKINGATIQVGAADGPRGPATLDKLIAGATTAQSHQFRSLQYPMTVGQAATISCIFKPGEYRYASLAGANVGPFGAVVYDTEGLRSRVYVGSNADILGHGIEPLSNGCYLVWLTVSCSTAGNLQAQIGYTDGYDTVPTFSGDGTKGAFFGTTQVEMGRFRTSLIPTETAAASRALDVLNINATPWLNPNALTLYWEGIPGALTAGVETFFTLSSAVSTTYLHLYRSGQRRLVALQLNNSVVSHNAHFTTTLPEIPDHKSSRIACSVTPTSVLFSVNGTSSQITTFNTPPVILSLANNLSVGHRHGSLQFNGHVGAIAAYPYAMGLNELAALTRLDV